MDSRVFVSRDALHVMRDDATLHLPNETGGILIGYYSADRERAIITEAWLGPDDSERTPRGFNRGPGDYNDRLADRWEFTEGTRYYLGEWHSHPKHIPAMSALDMANMQEIAATPQYRCPEPIQLLIVREGGQWGAHAFQCCASKCQSAEVAVFVPDCCGVCKEAS